MVLPLLSLDYPGSQQSVPTSVSVSPLAIATILDHHLRRQSDQDRVFGTLLGNVSQNRVLVKSAFGVPYAAKERPDEPGQFEVVLDQEHHTAMVDMLQKVNPNEAIVGWYATHPQLNSFTPLIHNFYVTECASSGQLASTFLALNLSSSSGPSTPPAIHLALDPSTLAFTTYVSVPLNISLPGSSRDANPKFENATFRPVACTLEVSEQERSGVDFMSSSNFTATKPLSLSTAAPANTSLTSSSGPLEHLHGLLLRTSDMLDNVLEYVKSVNAGERQPDENIGRTLWDAVGAIPAGVRPDGFGPRGSAKKGFEEEFNAHLSDVLVVSYLANVIQTQVELSGRLNLLT